MNRRNFSSACAAASTSLFWLTLEQAHALSLGDLTSGEASQGLKAALEKGATVAVGLLGQPDGFLGNPKVRIPLPGYLENATKALRMIGQGSRIDELITAMNRAAEQAVPMAKDLLVNAVRSMSVTDAKDILTGGDTSVTQFFAGKTRAPLGVKFLPVVTAATVKVGLAEKYNQVAGQIAGFGLMKKEDANIQQYVTGKSLDGLYLTIGEQERQFRQNPMASGSVIVEKVFGALR